VVVVDVSELWVLYGIKLNSKEPIQCVNIIRGIKKAKKLARIGARLIRGGTKHKCKTGTTEVSVRPHDGENKCCGEGCQGEAI
jgi:hypothetical protein